MPRPTGSMPPVVSLAMDEQTPEPMSTCLASRLREQGQLAKPRVTSSGEQRSCRSASWRGGLVAGVTEYRKDRTWRSCDYRQSPSVLAGLNGCGGKGTNGLYRCGRASLPGQGSMRPVIVRLVTRAVHDFVGRSWLAMGCWVGE